MTKKTEVAAAVAISRWDIIGQEIAVRACDAVNKMAESFTKRKYGAADQRGEKESIQTFHALYLVTCGYVNENEQKRIEKLFESERRWEIFYQEFVKYMKFCHDTNLTQAKQSSFNDARNAMAAEKQ